MHTEEYIAQLIMKYSMDTLAPSEKKVLDDWLSASEQNRDFFEEVTGGSGIVDLIALEDRDERTGVQEKILAEIHRRIQESAYAPEPLRSRVIPVAGFIRFLRRYAAAALLLLVAGVLVWNTKRETAPQPQAIFTPDSLENDRLPGSDRAILTLSSGQQVQLDPAANEVITDGSISISNEHGRLSYQGKGAVAFNTITTSKGGQYHILLSDGTGVWLNAASSIRYPTYFDGAVRSVSVTGEAYFEVAPDKTKPFVVSMPGGNKVEVLGTAFNINAYEDESHQVTTLVEGRIKIVREVESTLLRPGQQAIVANLGTLQEGAPPGIRVEAANVGEATAWRNNLFVFNKTDLVTILRQLSRWYDFEVRFKGPVPEKKFQGKIPRDIPLSQVLNALKMVGVSFELKGKELLVLTTDDG